MSVLNRTYCSNPEVIKLKMYTIAMAFEEGKHQGIEALNLELNDSLSLYVSNYKEI